MFGLFGRHSIPLTMNESWSCLYLVALRYHAGNISKLSYRRKTCSINRVQLSLQKCFYPGIVGICVALCFCACRANACESER
uniref:Uncharacterized protein n=1 Tax=Arundo donax TaxID=35708 RepID=A0A0A9D1R7_ARUDO